MFLRSVSGLRVVGDIGVEVAEDVLLCDLGRAVGERDLVEHTVGESFGEGLGVRYVVGEENYMGNIGSSEAGGPAIKVSVQMRKQGESCLPVSDFVIYHATLLTLVQKVINNDHRSLLRVCL